jgi:uncharacterized membrane protein
MSTPDSTTTGTISQPAPSSGNFIQDAYDKLRLPKLVRDNPPIKNANDQMSESLSPLEKLAAKITDKVGSMGFFFCIVGWTVLWCGYNILADEVPSLHFKAFDPFPAFVAYLLISNVIQIMLMPLIMVGQNVQGRHTEIRSELDFEINQKAEKEVTYILQHLEHNTELIIQLMRHLECRISDEELRAITSESDTVSKMASEAIKVPAA